MSGDKTTVNNETKYIGALGFKALHRKPTPILFFAEYFVGVLIVDSVIFAGFALSPLMPR